MGELLVSAKIGNLEDHFEVMQGRMAVERIRSVVVDDALVDTEILGLLIPSHLVKKLGLRPNITNDSRRFTMPRYEAVRLMLQGRECTVEVYESPEHTPVRIGRIPLASMDWIVDMANREVIGNPEHGGEEMFDAY